MSGERGCFFNSLLFLVIIFLPVLGQVIETFMILEDDHSAAGKVLWLVVIWALPVIVGPLLYLLFGQRPRHGSRVMFGQASGAYQAQRQ